MGKKPVKYLSHYCANYIYEMENNSVMTTNDADDCRARAKLLLLWFFFNRFFFLHFSFIFETRFAKIV